MRIMFIVNNLGLNEPFGPMILSAVLKEKGHQTVLGVLQEEDVERKIASWKPDMLAYSMMSVDMREMVNFHKKLRNKTKIFSILGGPHASLYRKCVDTSGVDAICVGEGEEAIIEVAERLQNGRDMSGIPNIMLPGQSGLELRPLIADFDSLPFMDRELVYAYPKMARFGIKGIWASRGCVFPCPYCFNNRQNELFKDKGKIVRRRSVGSIIEEMLQLKRAYRVAFVRIQDDVFVHRADAWLEEFAKRWSKEVRVPFYCLLRAELVTDQMAQYLREAGAFSVCMSIEAADDDVRKRMLRRRVSKQQLENAFRIFKKQRINVYANSMLAFPFTTLEHDIASVDLAIRLRPQMPNFSVFMPYPGTDLGDYCAKAHIFDPVEDEIDYGIKNMSPLSCFSEQERRAQYNLCQLAIVAIKFPFLRNLIVRRLIYLRPNKAFFFIHYIFAVTAYGRHIFYFKHSPREFLDLIVRTIRHYLFDYTKKEPDSSASKGRHDRRRDFALEEKRRRDELEKCMRVLSDYRCQGQTLKKEDD